MNNKFSQILSLVLLSFVLCGCGASGQQEVSNENPTSNSIDFSLIKNLKESQTIELLNVPDGEIEYYVRELKKFENVGTISFGTKDGVNIISVEIIGDSKSETAKEEPKTPEKEEVEVSKESENKTSAEEITEEKSDTSWKEIGKSAYKKFKESWKKNSEKAKDFFKKKLDDNETKE